MDVQIEIDPRLNTLSTMLPVMRTVVAFEHSKAMRQATFMLHGTVKPLTPWSFGTLRESIHPETIIGVNKVMGFVVTPTLYGRIVEEGSRPHWAPIEPLKLWAKRKTGDERVAYIAQRAIARRGTKAWHMFREAWSRDKDKVNQLFHDARDRIMRHLGWH